jgi:predicted aminopeptidase
VRARLQALYRMPLDPAVTRERKRAELEGLRPLLAQLPGFEGQEPSNALLALFATYTDLVPAFEKLLADAGGDLAAFYVRARAIAALAPQERKAALSAPSSPGPWSVPRR